MKKTETVEEFLARGGEIQKIPYEKPEVKTEPIRSNTTGGLPAIMTLSDGAHFFGETRKKQPTKENFLEKVNKTNLPQDIIDSLLGQTKDKT